MEDRKPIIQELNIANQLIFIIYSIGNFYAIFNKTFQLVEHFFKML